VWFNRRELDWAVVGWFAVGGVPLAFVGGLLFAKAPLSALTRILGAFLIAVVIWRHVRPGLPRRPPVKSFALIGAGASLLSAPFFLAYGLLKGAYIGTEALATVLMHVVKLAAYEQGAVLSAPAILVGLSLGPIMIGGSYVGKRVVDRLPEHMFVLLIEATMTAAGLLFLLRG
jgi:uncharacterized membrane protein YfcA